LSTESLEKEANKMKKKLFVLLIMIMVLSMVSISGCAATPEEENKADGVWCYLPTFERLKPITFDPYEGDPSKEFLQVPYVSKGTGIFTGTSTDYGLVVAHILDPNAPSAPMIFIDTTSFTDVEVDGKVGDLEMDVIGDRPDPASEWKGTWVITSGTDQLKDLQGQGTFWGPGWLPDSSSEECGDWGLIYYSGSINFGSD